MTRKKPPNPFARAKPAPRPASPFSRAKPPPPKPAHRAFGISDDEQKAAKRWADSFGSPNAPPISPMDFDALRFSNLQSELTRLWKRGKLTDEAYDELQKLRRGVTHTMTLIVEGTDSGTLEAVSPDGAIQRRVSFVGLGEWLLSIAVDFAERATIVDAYVRRTARKMRKRSGFPLYDEDEIDLRGGARLKGTGRRPPKSRKSGPKRKSSGRRTRKEHARLMDAERQARKRAKGLETKIRDMLKGKKGHARKKAQRDVERLLRRSQAGRSGQERAQMKRLANKRVFSRAKPKPRK